MRNYMNRSILLGAIAGALCIAGSKASAQKLGPQRQFLSIDAFYDRLQLDAGEGQSRIGIDGYGARLWINAAPFAGPSSVLGKTSIGLYYSRNPRKDRGIGAAQYGGELDIFPTERPYGGFFDPFISLGAGALRINNRQTTSSGTRVADIKAGNTTRFAFSPGVGVRLPVFSRVQLRFDAKDVIVFNRDTRTSGDSRTSHTLDFQGGMGIEF